MYVDFHVYNRLTLLCLNVVTIKSNQPNLRNAFVIIPNYQNPVWKYIIILSFYWYR